MTGRVIRVFLKIPGYSKKWLTKCDPLLARDLSASIRLTLIIVRSKPLGDKISHHISLYPLIRDLMSAFKRGISILLPFVVLSNRLAVS